MALVSGFLRQKCSWKKRPQASDGFDDFGQPIGASAVEIKCRWELRSGFIRGVMGDGSGQGEAMAVSHKVLVAEGVSDGDELYFADTTGKTVGGIVRSVETIVDVAGREQGRICYV